MVGFETCDDASVYRLPDGNLLVQTVDFFTPVVDDPYTFGRIAAANALSDVYAMGARPITALGVAAFPRKLGMEVLNRILRGGAEKAAEAGIAVAGGHTVDDAEPKYGLVVTGLVSEADLVLNRGARPGDRLILTKPLGVGALTTAHKRGEISEADLEEVVAVMEQLNAFAASVMVRYGAHACTDVTGFGLLGHLSEMAAASGVKAVVEASAVPVLSSALPFLREGRMPGGSWSNLEFLQGRVQAAPGVDPAVLHALYDAQTSGGLLMAVDSCRAQECLRELLPQCPWSRIVGRIEEGTGLAVEP